MDRKIIRVFLVLALGGAFLPNLARAQSFNASISGTVTDPSGAVVPNAQIALTAVGTGAVSKAASNEAGLYSFPNLQAGAYEVTVSALGFRDFVQRGIKVSINESVRVDVKLELGTATQTIEVAANASPLNFENAELKQAITPETIRELPLMVGGNIRAATGFVILMPGVSTGGGGSPIDARINGGMQSGDEAVLDGATMQDGMYSQSGMTEAYTDHPLSAESISEVSVLTSNYEPQYGTTSSAVITAVTKSGTNEFHGGLFEFHRNTVLNSRQFGIPKRPKDLENDFGGNIGGPLKIPGIWGARRKAYFFVNVEPWRLAGGARTPILSIPSLKERQGDFTDWVDTDGNLIPVYDAATTRPNPAFDPSSPVGPANLPYLRDQFMGCDGSTPNVICPSDPRLVDSLAKQWLQYLPDPTFPGPLNNYVVPEPVPTFNGFNSVTYVDPRFDYYYGEKDHFSFSEHYIFRRGSKVTLLPKALATEDLRRPSHAILARLNWDHTFTSSLLNHVTFGYNNIYTISESADKPFADKLPQISGVASHAFPPIIGLQDFAGFGGSLFYRQDRPTFDVNDLFTWVRGKHTIKFGGEFRALEFNNVQPQYESGVFNFSRLNTGLLGVNSGNAVASFLLGGVGSGSAAFLTVDSIYPRQHAWNLYAGDTWKATPKLSINYGIRWDVFQPAFEKFDRLSFLDPLGTNPGADNRPGRLGFAGTGYGAASFGRRHPEETWYRGLAPRLGVAYTWSPKTVVRAGYGIFFSNAYYPGWNGGIALDGFNSTPSFSSTDGGLTPAFLLSQGFPQNFQQPPFIDSSFLNGQYAPLYRPLDANRLPYSQQWNLSIEHQFTSDFYISTAYVGNKGTRLLSQNVPLNALDPKLLSMGQALFDEFQPGQTSLDGVPTPYPGWVEQMSGCPPTVAQALLPYPQYCGGIYGLNENAGSSTYHSVQLKAEKRFSHGIWMLASYTLSKLLTSSSDNIQAQAITWGGAGGVISPYERQRNKGLSVDDVPQVFSLAFVYQLPFGKGKRYLNTGGVVDKLAGGWQVSNIFRSSSGTPLYFRSSECNVPSQFAVGCIPATLSSGNVFAQDKGSFDPGKGPLFSKAAFEAPESFNFYYGKGPRISNARGFGFRNHDFSLIKNTQVTERVNVQFRAEFFNVWNWHTFACYSQCFGGLAFVNDVASPDFGTWNGSVSTPRNIQLGMKILF
jgi:hypothetical protein